MTKLLLNKVKPTSGISHALHWALVFVLPLILLILVRLDFVILATGVVLLSKWRMFAVRPRFWAANIRANGVDLMVSLSVVALINYSGSLAIQITWAVLYALWLILLKPRSDRLAVTAQAFVGQLTALTALYLIWADAPTIVFTALTGLICFMAAHHFFDTFDEPYTRMLAYLWGYFGAALAWLSSHWLLYYGWIAQPTLLLSALGYGLATLYYLDHNDRLGKGMRREFIFIMVAVIIFVLAFSDWDNKVV